MRLVVAATLVCSGLASEAAAQGVGPCDADRFDTKPAMSHAKIERRNDDLIRCAVRRWSVPGGVAKAQGVADCESSDYSWAHSDGNYGLFQIRSWSARARYWLKHRHWMFPGWHRRHSPPSWGLARANAFVAVRWVHVTGSWAPWSCG